MSDWVVNFALVAGWVAVGALCLRRRPIAPVGRHTMRRINTTIDTQTEGER